MDGLQLAAKGRVVGLTSTTRRAVASSGDVVASSSTSTSQRAGGPGSRCPRSVPARRRRRTVSGWMPRIAAASGTGTKRVTVGLMPRTVPDQSMASPWHCHGSAGSLWRRPGAPRHAPGRCSISGGQGWRFSLFCGFVARRAGGPAGPVTRFGGLAGRDFRVLPVQSAGSRPARSAGCGGGAESSTGRAAWRGSA